MEENKKNIKTEKAKKSLLDKLIHRLTIADIDRQIIRVEFWAILGFLVFGLIIWGLLAVKIDVRSGANIEQVPLLSLLWKKG